MVYEIQKAGMGKRLAAWMFDVLIVSILAVGIGVLLSGLLGYDSYNQTLDEAYARYEAQYDVKFDISQEEYAALSQEAKDRYDAALAALSADGEVMQAYNMTLNLTLVVITLAILAACLIWELAIPLWLGNGQTLGKKIFGLCLVRVDGVKLTTLQLFVRTLLGKFTVETMIPVYILLMLFWGTAGPFVVIVLLGLGVAQLACVLFTGKHTALHDLMAATVVTELSTQMIFRTKEDLITYQKKVAAEQADRQSY